MLDPEGDMRRVFGAGLGKYLGGKYTVMSYRGLRFTIGETTKNATLTA